MPGEKGGNRLGKGAGIGGKECFAGARIRRYLGQGKGLHHDARHHKALHDREGGMKDLGPQVLGGLKPVRRKGCKLLRIRFFCQGLGLPLGGAAGGGQIKAEYERDFGPGLVKVDADKGICPALIGQCNPVLGGDGVGVRDFIRLAGQDHIEPVGQFPGNHPGKFQGHACLIKACRADLSGILSPVARIKNDAHLIGFDVCGRDHRRAE